MKQLKVKILHVSKAEILGPDNGKRIFEAFRKNEREPLLDEIRAVKKRSSDINVNEYEIDGRITLAKNKSYDVVLNGNCDASTKAVDEAGPFNRVEVALPKRATPISARIGYTLAGAGSIIPFAAAIDLLGLIANSLEKQTGGVRQLYAGIIGMVVGFFVSLKLMDALGKHISKARNEFFQQVADAFETAVKAVSRKSSPKQESA